MFTAVHIVTSYLNEDAAISVAQVFIPGIASFDRWALAWGVVGMYLFAGAVFTSWPRRRFSRKTWRVIHLGSVVGVALALVHGYQMGSDVGGTVATRDLARSRRRGHLCAVLAGDHAHVAQRRALTSALAIHSQLTADSMWSLKLGLV